MAETGLTVESELGQPRKKPDFFSRQFSDFALIERIRHDRRKRIDWNPATHDLGCLLRKQGPLVRLSISVWENGFAIGQVKKTAMVMCLTNTFIYQVV